jgi:predicted AAA+ superfamily ATPase
LVTQKTTAFWVHNTQFDTVLRVNDGQLRRLLTDSSAWWRDREGWERDDSDLRDVTGSPFLYEPSALADLQPGGLYVLRGPRRVGKSVEVKRAISAVIEGGANPRLVLFCSCDGLTAQDLHRLIVVGQKDTATLEGERHWFLDEVTAVPGWAAVIKRLRDGDPIFRRSRVVLSGSSARDLREATKALAGRRGDVVDSDRLLLPMDFRSFCHSIGAAESAPEVSLRPKDFLSVAGEEAISALSPFFSELDHAWQVYLQVGGFPRAVRDFVTSASASDGFVQAMWEVISGDAFQTTEMSEGQVAEFIERLADGLAAPLNASSVARDVGLSDNHRVNDRISALGATLMTWRCHRVRRGLPNLRAQEKVYFVDPLLARLPHLRDSRRRAPDDSVLSEQQLGLLLVRSAGRERPNALLEASTVMYERVSSSAEIDFVGPELGIGFEGKYIDGPWRRAAQTLRSRGGGIFATRSVIDMGDGQKAGGVWAVPAGIVGWLLGAGASSS